MATQICPNCKQDSFTWSMDEESPLTKWACYNCNYIAWEDESKESDCPVCKNKTRIELDDKEKKYQWCSNCNETTLIETSL